MSPVNPETGLVSLPPFISGVSRQALVAKTVNSLIDGLSGRTITNLQIRGGITINGTVAVSTSGAMSSGATAILTGDGYYMDYNAGTPRFRVGTVAAGALTAGMYWSGSSLSVMGAITATSGSIGGWTINATSITDAAGVVGMSSAVTAGDDIRFWAGDATPANAEFRVTESGALTATSATISGSITATSGYIGGWTIGATTLVGGDVTLNSAGSVTLATSASSAPTDSSIRWVEGANLRAYQWMFGDGVATNSKVWGTTIQKADNASLAAASFVIKNVAGAMIGQWNMIVDASGNRYMNTDGYIYPGTGSATQAGRYIYDNGSNIVVDSVVVATHTHTGGAGGTIAWASIDKATSSIADITTKSAGALDSGNLAYARMPTGLGTWTTSGNVTLAYSVNAGHILTVQNLNTGTGAYAEVAAAVSGGPDTISMFALGPGYTTAGMYIAETGYLTTSSGMTGGMKIAVIANAAMDFYTNNSLRMTIEAGGDVNFSGALYPGNQTTHYITGGASGIGIGTTTPGEDLELASSGTNSFTGLILSGYNDQPAYSPYIGLRKSNSDTLGTISQTQSGDALGEIYSYGVNSSSAFAAAAAIRFAQSGAAGATYVPAIILLQTSDGSSAIATRVTIGSSGAVTIASLAGTGTRNVVVDANGVLSAP